jgi:hypothetical protein
VAGAAYGPEGKLSYANDSRSGQPATNASVVANFGCNTALATDFFKLTGNGPQYVLGVLAGNKSGGTSMPVLEKAAEAFAKAYSTKGGSLEAKVDAGIQAANKVFKHSPIPDDQRARLIIVRQKR